MLASEAPGDLLLTANSEVAAAAPPPPAPVANWFVDWANQQGINEFARLIEQAGLTSFIESCETPLTIFVPTNDAIRAMAATLPTDMQLLRELLCVHITMGNLRCAPGRLAPPLRPGCSAAVPCAARS